ncbi:hypothetical protein B0J14DRAFT_636327 [Halenospora varia]|nr:hypothetical protein B0J14DRAFT_636327 [Halenospora varia]
MLHSRFWIAKHVTLKFICNVDSVGEDENYRFLETNQVPESAQMGRKSPRSMTHGGNIALRIPSDQKGMQFLSAYNTTIITPKLNADSSQMDFAAKTNSKYVFLEYMKEELRLVERHVKKEGRSLHPLSEAKIQLFDLGSAYIGPMENLECMIGEVQGPVITLEYFNGNFTTIGGLPSDIWALGITICVLVFGSTIFENRKSCGKVHLWEISQKLGPLPVHWGLNEIEAPRSGGLVNSYDGSHKVNPAERVGIEEVVDDAWFGDVREEEMED